MYATTLLDVICAVTLDSRNENGEGSNLSRTSAKIDKSTQVNKQKGLKYSFSVPIQPGRPSYLRKSSAWDNAFFTSAGSISSVIVRYTMSMQLTIVALCLYNI